MIDPKPKRSKKRGTLTVCMGLPASGKSTWVRKNRQPEALIVCADAMRTRGVSAQALFGKMRREAGAALIAGRDVMVDACSLRWRDREPWLAMAQRFGARPVLVVFDTPLEVCRARDSVRPRPAGRLDLCARRMSESLHRVANEEWAHVELVEGAT